MKPMRIILAAIVGGIIMFGWGAFTHMALPAILPQASMTPKPLPGEETIVPALKASISEPGFYFFPPRGEQLTPAEEEAWEAKLKAGPSGIMIYTPAGTSPMSPTQFGVELLANIAAAFLAAILVSWLTCGYAGRLIACLFMGVFAWLTLEVSYVNWYNFPWQYAWGSLIDQGGGWLVSGFAIAGIVGNRAPCAPPAPAA
ncbi:hypothetical protein PHYC_01615 [Phycisphaerales bacterium]|nr:hypothetical protein PHYC_01615 [Phycisphaerales bacterium]